MNQSTVHTTQLHAWLGRMRAGDLSARDELLRAVCSRLEQVAAKMLKRFPNVGRFVETGDVLNSAAMRLLRSLEKLELTSMRSFYGLASEEIRRELLDLARHYYGPRGFGANVVEQKNSDDSRPGFDPPDQPEDQSELDRWYRLHEEVAKLPVEEREAIGLVFYHGWSQLEIAELFQVTDRTVRRWWKSGMEKLSAALGETRQEGVL